MGICHSYAPDGRCISLLKILLTNFCKYDCLYCVNRVTQQRAARALHASTRWCSSRSTSTAATASRACSSSSGIIRSPDYTMEQVVEVARVLREEHDFRGYIHLKTIPDASPELLAARRPLRRPAEHQHRAADARRAWRALAPEKDGAAIRRSMARLRVHIDDAQGEARDAARAPVASLPGATPQPRARRRASRRPARARR